MSITRYSKDHEWVRLDGDEATCGITNYAQEQLGDIVFIELPEIGTRFAPGDEAAVVESVKAAAEVYAPVAGEVIAVNDAIVSDPALVNADPTAAGWFFRLRTEDAAGIDELMDEEAYQGFLEELG
jgi:glycine cleavage system H protein